MTPFDAWALMVSGMMLSGGLFVLWIVPRIEEKERRRAAQTHAAE